MESDDGVPYGRIAMCAQDFISSLSKRPRIVRILLQFIFGKFAYHEFILLVDCFVKMKYPLYMNYELEDAKYHMDEYRSDFAEGLRKY